MNFTIKETSSEESDRQNSAESPKANPLIEAQEVDSPFEDSQSMESRSKPINLG